MPDVTSRDQTLESLVTRADREFYRVRNHVLEYEFSNGVRKYNDRSGETGIYEPIPLIIDDLYMPIVDDLGRGMFAI